MRILLATLHHPVCTGRFLTRALRRLGHEVRDVGWFHSDWAANHPQKWEPYDLMFDAAWADWEPDLVISVDPCWNPWHHPGYAHVPHVQICSDNHITKVRMPGIERYFLAAKYGPEWPVTEPDEEHWQFGYDPTLHVPSPIPWEEREYDVCIVGYSSERVFHDMKITPALKDAGFKVFNESGLYFQDYVNAYHNSRIGLCGTKGLSPAMRYWETPAMGCLPLCLRSREIVEMRPYGFQFVDTPQDAVDMLAFYAREPETAQKTAVDALRWVRPHTWDARAQRIIDWFEKER